MTIAAHYTQPDASDAQTVKVAEFRNQIEWLERKIHVDYHACVGAPELARWADAAAKVASELSVMVCKRAKTDDMIRRERALDKSATLIIQVRGI